MGTVNGIPAVKRSYREGCPNQKGDEHSCHNHPERDAPG